MASRLNKNPVSVALVALIFIGVVSTFSDSAWPSEGDKITYTITGDVYLGDKNSFDNPCVIIRKQIFEKIPAIQTIKREKLDKNSARYAFLIKQANKDFREAVEKAASAKGYDLVVERGGIRADDGTRINDITDEVITEVPNS